MNARSTAALTEAQRIERALDALVTAAIAAKPPWRRSHEEARSIGEILRDYTASTPAQVAANELLDDPVGRALRQAVTVLGIRLHEIGGMKLMSEVLDRVAAMSPVTDSDREGLIDTAFHGIGPWMS